MPKNDLLPDISAVAAAAPHNMKAYAPSQLADEHWAQLHNAVREIGREIFGNAVTKFDLKITEPINIEGKVFADVSTKDGLMQVDLLKHQMVRGKIYSTILAKFSEALNDDGVELEIEGSGIELQTACESLIKFAGNLQHDTELSSSKDGNLTFTL